ncbi:MAG: PhnD/SsuA/transferrin family substrate-binding protein [Candidatus Marinimicrobia bacterium]|jgi:phosphonate transport system substrate-binding protein|nr:PhnD/SsuA/transferrin family substrate-binding protein [Candidatus Neomarinimicrobiota bacterium]MDP6593050.1 PhnD/SsuA/transferrin family substrate-binding protein [Candidatus Neomarinimicrobiota bacterium]MDP6836098.1 PhnD/SsuA/transferrin family substrate-binding protein [Candidatus Neomarinimicrobiota bacterium]|tara:strand:+ start:219 stop:1127 length:909 start_codon:yes stop_codon:yes gene_type:complete
MKRSDRLPLIVALASASAVIWLSLRWATDISIPIAEPVRESRFVDKPVQYFGVVSRYTPREIYLGYQPIMDYLSEKTPYLFELKLSTSYAGTAEQLGSGEICAASLGSLIYVTSQKEYGLNVLLRPLNAKGKDYFHIVFVTRSDSPIEDLPDLRGKRLLFPSEESLTGQWMPHYLSAHSSIMPDDLLRYEFVPYHTTVAERVLSGEFDAGVVKSVVADQYVAKGLKVFHISPPIPSTPIVVSSQTPREIEKAISDALLAIDPADPGMRERLESWDEEFSHGFELAQNKDYDIIRNIIGSGTR